MLVHQEVGMMIQAIAEMTIRDMDEVIPMKEEGAVHIIVMVVCHVVDQEGTVVVVQAAMSAKMMKNGMHIWQPYHNNTTST